MNVIGCAVDRQTTGVLVLQDPGHVRKQFGFDLGCDQVQAVLGGEDDMHHQANEGLCHVGYPYSLCDPFRVGWKLIILTGGGAALAPGYCIDPLRG